MSRLTVDNQYYFERLPEFRKIENMAIYEISSDKFRRIDETSFSDAGLRECQDLLRLLRSQIEIVLLNMGNLG